jgi:hypothetical protein
MEREDEAVTAIAVLASSLAVCVAGFALFAYATRGLFEGEWDYRWAVVVTMPYGVVCGFMGAGGVFLSRTRFTAKRSNRHIWAVAGAAIGIVVALLFYLAGGVPFIAGSKELWFLAASAANGIVLGLFAWWQAQKGHLGLSKQ